MAYIVDDNINPLVDNKDPLATLDLNSLKNSHNPFSKAFQPPHRFTDQKHTWYLSRVPRVVPVEKNLSCGEIWPHDRFSCGQILHIADRHVDKFLTWQIIMWKKFSTWEMWRKFVMWRNNVSNLWCFVAFYAVLLQNRDLRSFVAISVLSRFTRFCVEKNSAKNYAPWRKND